MHDSFKTRKTLIQRVKNQQDEASWEEFTEAYNKFIYSLIRNMNISEHDADDLSQQVLFTLWKKISTWDMEKGARFRSWIAVITKNCVIDFIRKQKNDALRLEKAAQDENNAYLNAIRLPEIEHIAEKQWKIHITNLALENIKPFFSGHALDVFQLSLEGMSIGDIATRLDLKERSVSRLKTRVKTRLTLEIERLCSELD